MIRNAILRESFLIGLAQTEQFSLAKVGILQEFFGDCGPPLDLEEGEVIGHARNFRHKNSALRRWDLLP